MQNGFVETLIGAVVVVVAGAFFYYGWHTTDAGTIQGYEVVGRFDRVDGIGVGTDVRMSGIKIGTVTAQELDQKTYRALVRMSIRDDVMVPDDSSIKVSSEGLLGGSYLAISPGSSETMMKAGSEFDFTQGSIDFLSIISKAMVPGGDDSKKPEAPPTTPPTAEPSSPTPPVTP